MNESVPHDPDDVLDRNMRRISRGLSGFALVLMLVGFVISVTGPHPIDVHAIDLGARGQRLMLDGIIVLCLLPAVRVLAAGAYYAAARRLAQAVVALVVLLELISSIVTGG